ncbi:hypothetical protein [Brachyspira intermedia]|uniref:hypothetical protein n=1 Tax=Brachyspira intermedia TaxID=84377 RepID=UPI0030059EA1
MKKTLAFITIVMMIFIASCQKTPTTPDTVPISLQNFTEWLGAIKVADFTAQTANTSLTLTSEKEITAETALTSIKTALKALSKDNIVINNIDSLTWQEEITADKDGIIKVSVSPAEGMKFDDDLTASLANNEFTITVIINKTTPPVTGEDVLIDGAGSSIDNPITVNLIDESTGSKKSAPNFKFTIKTEQGISLPYNTAAKVSALQQAESTSDSWNILSKISDMLDSSTYPNFSTKECTVTIKPEISYLILEDSNIKSKTSQIYKVVVTVSYTKNGQSLTKDLNLYIKFTKNYHIVNESAIKKALIEGISGQTFQGYTPIAIKVNSNSVVDIARATFSLETGTFSIYENAGVTGSLSFINDAVLEGGFNTVAIKNGVYNKLKEIGISWDSRYFHFTSSANLATSKMKGLMKTDINTIFVTTRDGAAGSITESSFNIYYGIDVNIVLRGGWVE